MTATKTQCQAILAHIKRKPINPLQALSRYGCFRLAARIHDLRSAGWWIETNTINRNGKTYAEYRLVELSDDN